MTELLNMLEFRRLALVLAVAWFAVSVAMAIDLVAGIRKAKRAGQARTSEGYRRTVDKLCRYGTALLFGLIADLVMVVGGIYANPYASAVIALGLILIEAKSWFEKLEHKERTRMAHNLNAIVRAVSQRDPSVLVDDLNSDSHDADK